MGVTSSHGQICGGASSVCMLKCADTPVDLDTHGSWLMRSGCTPAWHRQAPPVPPRPRAHALTPWQTHAQALPGPDTRPARRRLEIPIRPGLHKHSLETAPAGPAAGWGSTWPMGWWGPHPTLPGSAFSMPLPRSFQWNFPFYGETAGLGLEGEVLGPRPSPSLGPQPLPECFLSCQKEPLWPVRVRSPFPPPGISLTPGPQVPPCPSPDHSAPCPSHRGCSKQVHAEDSLRASRCAGCLSVFAE